jgi:phosphoglycolate phosphatase
VIFDLDHTLLDPTEGIISSIAYALEAIHFPVPEMSVLKATVGLSIEDTFEKLTQSSNHVLFANFAKYFYEKEASAMNVSCTLLAGVMNLLYYLKQMEISLAIVSNRSQKTMMPMLQSNKLADHFEIIVGKEDVQRGKPDPEGLFSVLEYYKTSKEECLYIGDSITDGQAAEKAGMPFIAVLTGYTTREQFAKVPCMKIFADMNQLLAFLQETLENVPLFSMSASSYVN